MAEELKLHRKSQEDLLAELLREEQRTIKEMGLMIYYLQRIDERLKNLERYAREGGKT